MTGLRRETASLRVLSDESLREAGISGVQESPSLIRTEIQGSVDYRLYVCPVLTVCHELEACRAGANGFLNSDSQFMATDSSPLRIAK